MMIRCRFDLDVIFISFDWSVDTNSSLSLVYDNFLVISDKVSGESYKIYLLSTTPSPLQNQINPNYFETSKPAVRTPRTPSPSVRAAISNLLPTAIPERKRPTTTKSTTTKSIHHYLNQLGVKSTVTKQKKNDKKTLHPAYTSLPINYDMSEGKLSCLCQIIQHRSVDISSFKQTQY